MCTPFTLHFPGYSTWNGYGMGEIHEIGYGFHGNWWWIPPSWAPIPWNVWWIPPSFHPHSMVIPPPFHHHSTPIPSSFHTHSMGIPPLFHPHFIIIPPPFHTHSMGIPPPFHPHSTHYIPWSFHGIVDLGIKEKKNQLYLSKLINTCTIWWNKKLKREK